MKNFGMERREREERSGPFPFGSEEKRKEGTEMMTPTRYLDGGSSTTQKSEGLLNNSSCNMCLRKQRTASNFPLCRGGQAIAAHIPLTNVQGPSKRCVLGCVIPRYGSLWSWRRYHCLGQTFMRDAVKKTCWNSLFSRRCESNVT